MNGHTSAIRRYLSLAVWAGVLLSPSVAVAVGVVAAGVALAFGPALWRAVGRRRGAPAESRPPGQIVLGTDPAGRAVVLSERQLAAHALIVGAAGAGKTTTMLAVLAGQIRQGTPVVAIDMKGSPAFAAALREAAAGAGRRLLVWTPDGPGHWNPLAYGNATALKDKLISTERFTEPHYQRAAERYIQTALGVLHLARPERPAQLHEVVAMMEPRRLAGMLRNVPGERAERVQDYLAELTPDQISAVRGLGTRLALLSESCAGPYLRTDNRDRAATIDLRAGLEGGDVILLSLNSSVYGQLAAQLGALAIQDLVSATGERLAAGSAPSPATVAIDEFSALDRDNLLALLARGREFGVRVLVATQEMADLERAGRGFRDQVLGIVGVKVIHRQDVPDSAELVAQMAGTERYWEETEYRRGMLSGSGGARGSRRVAERYVVHPNEIKTLAPGHAVLLTKLPTAAVQRVRVTPPAAVPPAAAPPAAGAPPPSVSRPPSSRAPVVRAGPAPARSRPDPDRSGTATGEHRPPQRPGGRDYPAPGVTR